MLPSVSNSTTAEVSDYFMHIACTFKHYLTERKFEILTLIRETKIQILKYLLPGIGQKYSHTKNNRHTCDLMANGI